MALQKNGSKRGKGHNNRLKPSKGKRLLPFFFIDPLLNSKTFLSLIISKINFVRLIFYGSLLLFCSGSGLRAQEIIAHFTVNDGLPSSEVYYVHCDYDGYIWFCTDRGVSRYNGYEFENFSTQDGLTYNTVFKVFEDKAHNLWFSCFDGSIFIRDYASQRFRPFKSNDKLKSLLGNYNWIDGIFVTHDSLLLFPIKRNNEAYKYLLEENQLSRVDDFSESRFGDTEPPYFGAFILPNFYLTPSYFTLKSRPANQGRLDIERLYQHFKHFFHEKQVFPTGYTQCFIKDVGYFNGMLVYSTDKGLVLRKNDQTIFHVLPQTMISSSDQDREGNIWVTTTNKGVYVIGTHSIRRKDLSEILDNGDKITAMEALGDHLVVGTHKGYVVDVSNKKVMFSAKSLSSRVKYFSKEHGALTYYSANGLKVSIFAPAKKGKLQSSLSSFSLSYMPYLRLLVDEESDFMFGPGWYSLRRNDSIVHTRQQHLNHACVGEEGQVYFCYGAQIFVIRNLDFEKPIELTRRFGIERATVRHLSFTEDSLLVIATSGDGVLVSRQDQLIAKFGRADGLLSDMISACYVDAENKRIWCATNRGVSIIDYELGKDKLMACSITNLTKMHGLPTNYISAITDSGDSVWVTSDQSLASIPKTFYLEAVAPPKVDIVALINADKRYSDSIPVFEHHQNDLEIHYQAISLQRPEDKKFYRYRLQFLSEPDEEWNYTNERGIWFKNLDAGDYRFEVSARSQNSSWSQPGVMAFSITPFFWDRLWVRVAFWLLLLFLLTASINLYIHNLKRKNLKAMELTDLKFKNHQLELASLRGQMNPHFTFNVLNSIQNLILKGDKWEANQLLTGFSKLIRSSLEYSRIDFLPIQKELSFLENYLRIEKKRDPDKFDFQLKVYNQNEIDDLYIPSLLVQPICENAIKHAFVEQHGKLEVRVKQLSEETIEVKVIDDGIGYFNASRKRRATQTSLGMDIVKSRLDVFKREGMKAGITINPGNPIDQRGTVVTLILPCK